MAMTRSLWGWGYEEKQPSGRRLEALRDRAEALTGTRPEPAPPAPPRIRAPRRSAPAEWTELLGPGDDDRARHTYGKGYRDLVRAHAGDFSRAPDFVLYPRHEADVAAILAVAQREQIAVIPFGGGTSVVSGVEPQVGPRYGAVASLDLSRLDRVVSVDPISRTARIQAGIFGPALESQLGSHGLTLRHFPQSFEFSTLGGWLATRAGGHFATVYTHIDDLCQSLRMVTPSGLFETGRVPASGAGPDGNRLALGNEGAFGVITEATMRLFAKPRFRLKASVFFARFEDASDACRAISQAALFPSNCRLLDQGEAFLNGVSGDGSTVLLLGFESTDGFRDEAMTSALRLATGAGGVASEVERRDEQTPREASAAESWRDAFLEAPYLQTALVSLGVLVDTFETCCTWTALPRLYERLRAEVGDALQTQCGGGVVTCRFTHVYPDGPAPYFTFVGKAAPGRELEQWAAIKSAASKVLLEEGATITHHHAVGRLHRPWAEQERSPLLTRMLQAVKREVDPAKVMNPGALLAE